MKKATWRKILWWTGVVIVGIVGGTLSNPADDDAA